MADGGILYEPPAQLDARGACREDFCRAGNICIEQRRSQNSEQTFIT